jgi:TonB family protein
MSPPLWFANFLSYCLQVLVLVLAATALPALFRLRAPRVLLAYWQGMLLTCLILPLLQPWKSLAVASSIAEGTVSVSFRSVPGGAAEVHSWLYPLIASVLLAGMLVRLAWLALGIRRLRAIRRTARAFDPLPEWVRELESRLHVSSAWYLSPEMESPATFGIRPPSILLPKRFPTLNEAFQRAIAGHELLHVARRDWIFNLVEEVILTVFWFHPAVAWVVNRIRLSREQAVDEEVVHSLSARKPYMSALLEIARGVPGPALGAAPTFLKERQLANRIELLVKEITMSKTRFVLSLSAIAGLLVLAGVVSVWAFPLRAPAQAAAGRQSAEKKHPSNAPDVIPPVTQVPPVYPPEAKKAGIQGIVRLRVTINKDGTVLDLRVLSGPPQLAKAALEAVVQWRYSQSEEVRVTIVTINFTLAKDGATAPGPQASRETPQLAKNAPKVITKVNPVYPLEAKRAGIEGNVVLRTTIEKDGSVSNLEVVSGNPLLVKPALDAVQQWRYEPSVTGSIVTTVTISFSLEKDRSPRPDFGGGLGSGASGGVYSIGNGVSAPIPIYKPDPPYTKEAKAAKLQGTVVLSIVIGVDGAVTDAKPIEPFDKGLTENAIQTVKTWKFKPAMKDGKPVACRVSVEISFRFF